MLLVISNREVTVLAWRIYFAFLQNHVDLLGCVRGE